MLNNETIEQLIISFVPCDAPLARSLNNSSSILLKPGHAIIRARAPWAFIWLRVCQLGVMFSLLTGVSSRPNGIGARLPPLPVAVGARSTPTVPLGRAGGALRWGAATKWRPT